jgi:dTDP-4-dehydrorhamnose 3,5-epimerase
MTFHPTSLPGVWRIEPERREDERGFLLRTYCEMEFQSHGLNTHWPQCNLTLTKRRGMLRGLHYQIGPQAETKLVRCVAGAVWDVVVDIRPESSTFKKWEAFELTSENNRQLYIPEGYAHGFQCLTDDCRLFYQMSDSYAPGLARGVRWNDPAFGILWPVSPAILSPRDEDWQVLETNLPPRK